MNKLPDWAICPEKYQASAKRERYLFRSLLHVTSLLRSFHALREERRCPFSPLAGLLALLFFTLLCALTHRVVFLLALYAPLLLALCFLPAEALRSMLLSALLVAGASLLLVAPAVLFGGACLALLIPVKALWTMLALRLYGSAFSWNSITGALARLHVPDVIIFLLDTMLRNLDILARMAEKQLSALRLRSIGRDKQGRSLFQLLGTLFLRTQVFGEATQEAMVCRGFSGTYPRPLSIGWRKEDTLLLLAALLYCLLFFQKEMPL